MLSPSFLSKLLNKTPESDDFYKNPYKLKRRIQEFHKNPKSFVGNYSQHMFYVIVPTDNPPERWNGTFETVPGNVMIDPTMEHPVYIEVRAPYCFQKEWGNDELLTETVQAAISRDRNIPGDGNNISGIKPSDTLKFGPASRDAAALQVAFMIDPEYSYRLVFTTPYIVQNRVTVSEDEEEELHGNLRVAISIDDFMWLVATFFLNVPPKWRVKEPGVDE